MKTQIFPKKEFSIFLLTLIISGCSPERRLQRLVDRHSELKTIDTIQVHDTFIFPVMEADTMIPLIQLSDTVLITNNGLEIMLLRVHDTIHVKGKCKADTVIKTLRIPVEKIKLVKSEMKARVRSVLPWIVLGLIFIVMFFKVVTR